MIRTVSMNRTVTLLDHASALTSSSMTRKHNRPRNDIATKVDRRVELARKVRLDVDAGQEAVVEGGADLVVVRAGDGQASDTAKRIGVRG